MPDTGILNADILVVGSGAAGMSAAAAASSSGARVIIADERSVPGGILNQCVHRGFGMGRFGEDMSGPEYSEREYEVLSGSPAVYLPDTRVLSLRPDRTAVISGPAGIRIICFKECVIACGCTERSLWSLPVAGTRPQGVFTAGEAQDMIENGGYDIRDRIFILGSGDIGQIMARRFRQLGKSVVCMAEISDHLGGMKRNQEECIKAYDIPVMLNSTVAQVHGSPEITGVTVHHSDTGKDEFIGCGTLITALGLEPDRSLAEDLKDENGYPDWIHFCGNADYVHEIADSASTQGEKLGRKLAELVNSDKGGSE